MIKFQKILFIIICISCNYILAQNKHEQISKLRPYLNDKKYDDVIKESLIILYSGQELTLVDSFELYNVFSYSLSQVGDYKNALFYAKTSVNLEHRLFPDLPKNHGFLIPFFNYNKQFDSTIFYQNKIIDGTINDSRDGSDSLLFTAYNNLGFTYYLAGQLDSAEFYYMKVVADSLNKYKHSSTYGLTMGNLGQLFYLKKNYKKALDCILIDAELTKNEIPESYNSALLAMAKCYYFMNNYTEAQNTLNKFFKRDLSQIRPLIEANILMSNIYSKLEDEKNSAKFLRKTIQLKDSLYNLEKPSSKLMSELSRVKIESFEKNLLLINEKRKAQDLALKYYIIGFAFILVLLVFTVLFFIIRNKKNKQIQQLKTDLISADLINKKKDLTNTITNLTFKRKFIDDIQVKLKSLKNQTIDEIKDGIVQVNNEFNVYKDMDKNLEALQSDINKVNSAFFKELENKYPDLTTNEKEFCGLILLKLTSKDIANIRNVTPNAIKKTRQRIRKKLPITESQSLFEFFDSISFR